MPITEKMPWSKEARRKHMKKKRAAESNEEREVRIERDRVNTATARKAESEQQKRARNEAVQINTTAARKAESLEQKKARNEAVRINNAAARVSTRQSIKAKYYNIGRRVDTADFYEDNENDSCDKYDV